MPDYEAEVESQGEGESSKTGKRKSKVKTVSSPMDGSHHYDEQLAGKANVLAARLMVDGV